MNVFNKPVLVLLLGLTSLAGYSQNAPSGGYPQGGGRPQGGGMPQQKKPEVGYGKLIGKVVDAETKAPIPFATIALLDINDGKPVDGNVADENGGFIVRNIPEGKYKVTVSFIGYETFEKSPVEYDGKGKDVDLGTVSLGTSTQQLEEVEVVGQRELITEKVDRMVYNAEKDATTRGGDATDVLKRVPLLSVDLDGNVSLRGSQNIKVLIDNRPSTITAGSIADALKQIPADQIKSVEVITSPSARYDAEGTGGIINIITKKNNLQGASLNINSSAGNRGSNLGLNANYRKGRMGATLGGFGRVGYNIRGSFENEQLVTNSGEPDILTLQSADTRNNMMFGRYNLGWDYELNKYNWVSASARIGVFNFNGQQDRLFSETYEDNNLINSSLRDVEFANLSNSVDFSLNYIKTFEKPQKEFSILSLYSQNNRTNDFENLILDQSNEEVTSRFKNDNKSYNKEVSLQADYISPINDDQIFEIGIKEIMRFVTSDYQYFQSSGLDDPYEPIATSALSNEFSYNQNVAAGYMSYTLGFLEKYSVKAGARYEYTTIDANFQDEVEVEIPSYGVFVPSLNLSRKLKQGNMIKAAYNRRIQRPSLQFLNPNIEAANPKNITQGNPNLEPEYTNNYELSYSTFMKGTSLNFSAFMRNTNGSIQAVREVQGQDTLFTTYQNIGEEDAYGMSLFANINISKKFMLNGGVDGYYAVLNNNVNDPLYNASNEGFVFSGRIFGNYDFTDTWGLQFFSFFRGKQVQLQGYQTGFYMYSLSLKKDFKNDRGSVGFGAENFLTGAMKMRSEINTANIQQSSINEMRNMNFKVNFTYNIGKMNANPMQQRRKRKSIENNDLKDGGGNEQMMNN